MTTSANSYRLSTLDDTRIQRVVSRGEDDGVRWLVTCPCLFRAGPFLAIDDASVVFHFHKENCEWPR